MPPPPGSRAQAPRPGSPTPDARFFSSQAGVSNTTTVPNIRFLQEIATGAFGKVWAGFVMQSGIFEDLQAGQHVAVKELDLSDLERKFKTVESAQAHLAAEIAVLETLRAAGPLVVQYYGCHKGDEKAYLIMERHPGIDLFDVLSIFRSQDGEEFKVRQSLALHYAAEILAMFELLHGKNILYRDLRAENILLDKRGHLVLCDFGLSRIFPDGIVSGRHTPCGSPEYSAAEVFVKESDYFAQGYDEKSEVWSYGILLYEIFTAGQHPYAVISGKQGMTMAGLKIGIEQQTYKGCAQWEQIPVPIQHLIIDCLQWNPADRPTVAEIKQRLMDMGAPDFTAVGQHKNQLPVNPFACLQQLLNRPVARGKTDPFAERRLLLTAVLREQQLVSASPVAPAETATHYGGPPMLGKAS